MTTYRPSGNYQLAPEGGPYGGFNCTPASFAVAVDYATLGGSRVTSGQMRAWSDEPTPDPKTPGLNIPQCIAVCRDRLGVTMVNRTGDQWSDAIAALRAGRGIVIQYLYGSLPAEYRYSATFRGPHASFASQIDSADRLLFYDPLRINGAPRWVPAAAVGKAAVALAKQWKIAGVAFAVTRVVPKLES